MKLRNLNLFLAALAISSCGPSSAEDAKPKPSNDMGKEMSKAGAELSHQADRAEHAITSSVKNMSKGTSSKTQGGGNDFSKGASKAMNALGDQATKAEHAITSSVKSAPSKTSKGTNDLGKGASKAMNALGDQATKAEHAITSSVKNMEKPQADKTKK